MKEAGQEWRGMWKSEKEREREKKRERTNPSDRYFISPLDVTFTLPIVTLLPFILMKKLEDNYVVADFVCSDIDNTESNTDVFPAEHSVHHP